jgi:hypothetical protein
MMITSGLYISYSWGDDSSPEAREREEIVVDLCHSFAKRGIVIHRDKDEVRSGDSIEEFGERIAKAPVVLAVISYRSLRSECCMKPGYVAVVKPRNFLQMSLLLFSRMPCLT